MKAHFLELDIILRMESKPWIVDKSNPNIPIARIEPHDFNLFKSGIYKSQKNKINFNGKIFWLPTSFMNSLKIKSKVHNIDISNLGISMQEFMNPEIIENIPFEMNMEIFRSMVNKNDDIYIICSKNTKRNFEKVISKLESEMYKMGLKVKNYYYISETFYNKREDEISHNKSKLLLQHLIGLKSDGNKFINEEIQSYKEVFFYDDNQKTIQFCRDVNKLLESMFINSDKEIKLKIKDTIRKNDLILIIKEWTHNLSNKWKDHQIEIVLSNIIKSFENFKSN